MKALPICTICRQKPADHNASHIFPRFMGVTLLTTTDNKRKAYIADKIYEESNPKEEQDTPKVANILCCECESKIGALERIFANQFFHSTRASALRKNTNTERKTKSIRVLTHSKVDYNNFKLVVYSMLYRALVSNHIVFSDLNVTEQHKESIRKVLNNETAFIDIPLYVIISESDTSFGENYIYAGSIMQNAPLLWANEFIFVVDLGNDDGTLKKFESFKIQNGGKIKIGVFTNQAWDKLRQVLLNGRIEKLNWEIKSEALSNLLASLKTKQ